MTAHTCPFDKQNATKGNLEIVLLDLNASYKGKEDRGSHLMEAPPRGRGYLHDHHLDSFCSVYSDFNYQVRAKRQKTKITELFPKPCQFGSNLMFSTTEQILKNRICMEGKFVKCKEI
jgi:hypothetical protein